MDAPTPGSGDAGTAAPGRTVGNRYTLGASVGSGGMGTVWRAHDELLRRDVAVKEVLLPPGLPAAERQVLCERTLREARAAAALNHPAVVRVYDVVQQGDQPWIVMELLDARSISEVLRDDGPMTVRKVAEMGLAILGALEAAHRIGVLHRDVKPGNVLIGKDGRTTLTDFGVARSANESPLTSTGLLLGSPQYIAPERARGQKFGPASDLWSLGATLYTSVEGRPPFDRGDPLPTMTAVVCEPPDPVTFAGPLAPILDGLLEKDPETRWDAARTRTALRTVLAGGSVEPAAVTAAAGTSRPTSSGRPGSTGRPTSPTRRAIASRIAGAVAQRSPARALEGTAAMEAPAITGAQPAVTTRAERRAREAEAAVSPARALPAGGATAPVSPTPLTARAPSPATPQDAPRRVPAGAPAPTQAVPGIPPPGAPAPGTPRRAVYLESPEAMRASAAGDTSGIPRSAPRDPRRLALYAAAAAVIILVAGFSGYAISNLAGGDQPASRWTSQGGDRGANVQLVAYADPNGFSVNVPSGWTKEVQNSSRVRFFADSTRDVFIQLYVMKATSTDQQKIWEASEGYQRTHSSNYARVGFAPAKVGDRDAVDWEWTFTTSKGQKRHVLDRGVVIDGKSYQLYYSAPDEQYASGVALLDEVSKSFRVGS